MLNSKLAALAELLLGRDILDEFERDVPSDFILCARAYQPILYRAAELPVAIWDESGQSIELTLGYQDNREHRAAALLEERFLNIRTMLQTQPKKTTTFGFIIPLDR